MTATETQDEGSDDEPHRPVRDFVKWKNLGVDLNQDPGDHDIRDRDAIDLAPFQFGKKLLQAPRPGKARSDGEGPQDGYAAPSR